MRKKFRALVVLWTSLTALTIGVTGWMAFNNYKISQEGTHMFESPSPVVTLPLELKDA
jgi:hypothetical protein